MLKQYKIQFKGKVNNLFFAFLSMFCSMQLSAQATLNNITLTTPFNEQKIEAKYPLFGWSSTMSFQSQANITYQFRLVEVFPNQPSATAILSNPALYEKEVGTATALQYPVDAPELQNCKQYAWQVIAYDKTQKVVGERDYKVTYTNKIAQSVPYVFQTACKQNARITNPSSTEPYIILAKTVDNYVFKVSNNTLNIKYIEDDAGYELKYTLYDWKRTVLLTNTTTNAGVGLDNGWNYLTIDLNNPAMSQPVATGNIYQLEVETPKGDIYKAKFEIQ